MGHPLAGHLMGLERPGRYTGGEVNAVIKEKFSLRWCLVYPDVYEMGMSNTGLAILYEILNSQEGVWAERAFLPWRDAIEIMEKNGIPLFSLESKTPLSEFHVIGITLQTELTYTNALKVLALAGVPLFSSDRDDSHPLVVAGGPCTGNPLPVSEFFDAFAVGDGEELVREMNDPLTAWARGELRRDELLGELAKIEGLWVPGHNSGVKRRFSGLTMAPVKPPVPNIAITHDRFTAELTRGCLAGCRFCQGGFFSRPLRMRPLDEALEIVDRGLASTGWEEVGLAGFSLSEYPWLAELVEGIKRRHPGIRISVPSLPTDALESFLPVLEGARTSSFTLAPETGSERLRRVINKPLSPELLEKSLEAARRFGVKRTKLYFMIGLPTEIQEDLLDTARLLRSVARGFRSVKIKASFAVFVPRPHTPFQWEGQIEPHEARERFDLLRRNARAPNLTLSLKNPFASLLEGVLARGGPELGPVIKKAYENRALFDDWREGFAPKTWERAFHEEGLDILSYLEPREPGSALPWDLVDSILSRGFLVREHGRARIPEMTSPCRDGTCTGCGPWRKEGWELCFGLPRTPGPVPTEARPERPSEAPASVPAEARVASGAPRGLLMILEKKGQARFLSGNDVLRALVRALQRAGFSLLHTRGFVPRPRISAGPPAPLGVASECEAFYAEVFGGEDSDILGALRESLPPGLGPRLVEPGPKPRWGDILGVVYALPPGLAPVKPVEGLEVQAGVMIHRMGSGSLPALFREGFGPASDITALIKKSYLWNKEPPEWVKACEGTPEEFII